MKTSHFSTTVELKIELKSRENYFGVQTPKMRVITSHFLVEAVSRINCDTQHEIVSDCAR